MKSEAPAYMYRMWEQGQAHLAGGRYVLARRELEAAEAIAWRDRDAPALARMYLPLLEARRQIRYHAVEGMLLICPPGTPPAREQQLLDAFLGNEAGTILLACSADGGKPGRRRGAGGGWGGGEAAACRFAGSVQYEAQRTGRWLEALLLIEHGRSGEVRVAAQADPTFAAGLPVTWVKEGEAAVLGETTDPELTVPLPGAGRYSGSAGLGAVARESLIAAWEALALKWQRRHPPPRPARGQDGDPREAGWEELAWLRLALRIDPACEPVTMRLIAVAEAIGRM